MKKTVLAAMAAVSLLALSVPGIAADPMPTKADEMHGTTSGSANDTGMMKDTSGNSMGTNGSMGTTTTTGETRGKPMSADAMNTCEGMLSQGKTTAMAMAEGRKKTMAMREITTAEMAMNKGHKITCMTHMKKAMSYM